MSCPCGFGIGFGTGSGAATGAGAGAGAGAASTSGATARRACGRIESARGGDYVQEEDELRITIGLYTTCGIQKDRTATQIYASVQYIESMLSIIIGQFTLQEREVDPSSSGI